MQERQRPLAFSPPPADIGFQTRVMRAVAAKMMLYDDRGCNLADGKRLLPREPVKLEVEQDRVGAGREIPRQSDEPLCHCACEDIARSARIVRLQRCHDAPVAELDPPLPPEQDAARK